MPVPVPVSPWGSIVGIAKEATPGTPVAPTNYFRPDPMPVLTPKVVLLEDKGSRAAPVDVYNMVQGVTSTEYSISGDVFADMIGFPAASILGEVATTGAGAPYTHLITLLNTAPFQPTKYTITDYYGVLTRQIPAFMWSELTFDFTADGLLKWTSKGLGWAMVTTSKPTPSFSTVTPVAAWRGVSTIGGSGSGEVLSASVSIKRDVNGVFTADAGANPRATWGGRVSVSGKAELIMENDTELQKYLVPATTSLVFDFVQGASAALTEVKLQMSSVQYTSGSPDRGSDFVKLPVDFRALANTTDVGASGGYGPCVISLKNALASGTYV